MSLKIFVSSIQNNNNLLVNNTLTIKTLMPLLESEAAGISGFNRNTSVESCKERTPEAWRSCRRSGPEAPSPVRRRT
jgi:hypothetical protein